MENPFLLGSTLTEKQARQIAEMAEEASLGASFEVCPKAGGKGVAPDAVNSHDTPATPSGMKPPFKKPNNAPHWRQFAKKIRRLIADAIRL